jgi:hypothetical protein
MVRGMTVRRLVSVLCVVLVASATTVVVAQPKGGAKKAPAPKGPVAPAKDAAPPAPAAGSGSAAPATGSDAGSAVQMAEDPPPSDMEGINENPDAPKGTGDGSAAVTVVAPVKKKSGYPIEESQRPITLPQNMSEISLAPHAQVNGRVGATDALRARYGITRQVQLGLTYVLYGAFDDPKTLTTDKVGFHPGKAVGLDVTVLLQDWLAVRVGVPVYIDPVAVGLTLGAPMKFIFTDKFALGGMDELLTFKIRKFAPTFYQEAQNAAYAAAPSGTITSDGALRPTVFGQYQQAPKMVLYGRLGVNFEDFGNDATAFIRAGFNYTPRRYLDVGLSLGFDDLSVAKSFAPAGFIALRI